MLKNYDDRLSKYNFEKKIILHKKGVELWGLDGTVFVTAVCTMKLYCVSCNKS